MKRLYIDMSTARGIQRRVSERIVELKEVGRSGPCLDYVVEELTALHAEIDKGLDDLIEDMYRADMERAKEQQIRLDDAGLSVDDLKLEQF